MEAEQKTMPRKMPVYGMRGTDERNKYWQNMASKIITITKNTVRYSGITLDFIWVDGQVSLTFPPPSNLV